MLYETYKVLLSFDRVAVRNSWKGYGKELYFYIQ